MIGIINAKLNIIAAGETPPANNAPEVRLIPVLKIDCWTKLMPGQPDICNRDISLYQLWRLITKGSDENKAALLPIIQKLRQNLTRLINDPIQDNINEQGRVRLENARTAAADAAADLVQIQGRIEAERRAVNELERSINTEVDRRLDHQQRRYDQYQAIERKLTYFKNTMEMNKHYSVGPITVQVFCPYCAGAYGNGEGMDACNFINKEGEEAEAAGVRMRVGHVCNDARLRRSVARGITSKVGNDEICYICYGPATHHHPVGASHSHQIVLQDGTTQLNNGPGPYLFSFGLNRTSADPNNPANRTCVGSGGGGVWESAARILAFRDIAREQAALGNAENMNITYNDLAIRANQYAYIIRRSLEVGELPVVGRIADPNNVVRRVLAAIAISERNLVEHQANPELAWPDRIITAPVRADRAVIDAQVRAEMAAGAAPAGAPAAPGVLADDVIAAMIAAGMTEEEIQEARDLAAEAGPAPAAALGEALRREPSEGAAAQAVAAAIDAGPAAVVAAADVAAANPGIAQRIWNYFFDFWANPGHVEGGMRTRRRRTKYSSRKTRQRR